MFSFSISLFCCSLFCFVFRAQIPNLHDYLERGMDLWMEYAVVMAIVLFFFPSTCPRAVDYWIFFLVGYWVIGMRWWEFVERVDDMVWALPRLWFQVVLHLSICRS
jgi:hypothetical protein